MRFDYVYKVHKISPNGMATVEYVSAKLGSITRMFVVPYDRGEEQVRRRVVEHFPVDLFYSRHLELNESSDRENLCVTGGMSVDFDDHFYDLQDFTSR